MSEFENQLRALINRRSMESASNTPDFILADYLSDCLASYNRAVIRRAKWYGGEKAIIDPVLLKLPWRVWKETDKEAWQGYWILNADGKNVGLFDATEAEATAIVEIVNSHWSLGEKIDWLELENKVANESCASLTERLKIAEKALGQLYDAVIARDLTDELSQAPNNKQLEARLEAIKKKYGWRLASKFYPDSICNATQALAAMDKVRTKQEADRERN